MTEAEHLAAFVVRARYEQLSEPAREALKLRVLDALGCALGALDGPPIARLRAEIETFGGRPLASMIGGGQTAPDRAAFFNSALVRYLDFNDSFLAKGETCHPSDNLGAVLAASEYAGRSGREFLTALAVAYQVQCRLSEAAPVRAKGFDHTTQGAYAVAAGVAKALGMSPEQTANAIAISGTAFNALRVTRTGRLSNWKGLAYPNTAFCATHATFLALHGITGPLEVFEGNKGFKEAIAGPFSLDWEREGLEAVRRTIVKKYNAEIHSQSSLEAILELRERERLDPSQVERITLDVFDVAYNIIGGGEEGDKHAVRTKEQADHSLPYMVAVALLDGQVTPAQYAPERILREDVQALLRKITVRPDPELSRRFPDEMPVRLRVELRREPAAVPQAHGPERSRRAAAGRVIELAKSDYEGFHTQPMSWKSATEKFDRLAAPFVEAGLRRAIAEAVGELENRAAAELAELLAKAGIRRAA
jgi:2-methylcitrate dehydratase